jgi:hypothetical protein
MKIGMIMVKEMGTAFVESGGLVGLWRGQLTHVLELLAEFDSALPEVDGVHAEDTCHER